ncbi:DNA topoisomerase (ATP-hydrolyzing) subunit A [Mycoplasmoides pirum]|uniref:DNA topoisomerase (ATP-hydrolyzing) subunit A n=1 Tax=Mycoplasmoides pirum TaxID=2122 RepID=UPI000489212F|nr:DNA topoisomerase (ATP-hydrolyzing) subunit A [Mycoplasmoides pirum]
MKPNNLDDQIKESLEKTVVKDVSISTELENSFMEYAMSVIVARALPDARDGLKPVHRRILYGAHAGGMHHDKPFKKSARIVGEIMGKYHPHGDSAIYETMVRMAQDFSLRYMLIDGHGNFGSLDGDSPAAMRYTEARLSKIAAEMLRYIDKNTVDFVDNYDATETEPMVLPALFPNLLANGASGIAVGMATNIPPHNLSELIDGIKLFIKNPNANANDLRTVIKGPDFPTYGEILGESGIIDYFSTGRGSVTIRSKAIIEELPHGKSAIVITEIPYMVNKANLIEKIANLVKMSQIEGISDLRDESSHEGVRIVIEVKKNVVPEVLLNQLYKTTQLQSNFSVNMLSLVNGEPKLINLPTAIKLYLDHQVDVLTRKTEFDLKKAKEREHILEGLVIATKNIDAIIEIIKKAKDNEDAAKTLISKYNLSDLQAKAILDMRLRNLSGLERQKLEDELIQLKNQIKEYEDILKNNDLKLEIISNQLDDIKKRFGDERRTEIIYGAASSIEDEDLIPVENIVITMSDKGYLKRIPVETYKSQHRGGVGIKGMNTHEDDDVSKLLICSTHSDLLFFTDKGKVYRIRAHQIPSGSRQSKGIPAINIIDLEKDEKICSLLSITNYESGYFFYCTKKGTVKKTEIQHFERINRTGKIAISLNENDTLFDVIVTSGKDEIYIGISNGHLVRFNEDTIRSMGRTAAGVRGVRMSENDEVIGLSCSENGNFVLSVGENGIGKLTDRNLYRLTNRGSKGVITLKITEKTGKAVVSKLVNGDEDILMISSTGNIVRTTLTEVGEKGRATSGVKLINLDGKEKLQSLAIFKKENSLNEN